MEPKQQNGNASMRNHTQCWLQNITLSICACLYLLLPFSTNASQNQINEQILILEEEFRDLSHTFYVENRQDPRITDISQLQQSVAAHISKNESIRAIQLLYSNIDTINNNIDHSAVFDFVELLLENNEWQLASNIYESIQYEGDKSLTATVQFLFAKYHARRNEWQDVHDLLRGHFTELSDDNSAYAHLLNGSALQHLKQHRAAAISYSKIPQDSRFYNHGQLNTAITNIRQGWWTDAQTIINRLLKTSNKNNKDELINRLNLVLGYSLLQREYYRDARHAFRRIGLDSRYTNRALLGIGLTATSQGDFIGGLNALTILKDKKTPDLSVDESYLLIPYIYEKLQQELTVSASYTEAMNYYKNRIKVLKNIGTRSLTLDDIIFDTEAGNISIQNNSLDYVKYYPASFIMNFYRLKEFDSSVANIAIKNKIASLMTRYKDTLNMLLLDLLSKRINYMKSYLNQSRYGLARLYDSSQKSQVEPLK